MFDDDNIFEDELDQDEANRRESQQNSYNFTFDDGPTAYYYGGGGDQYGNNPYGRRPGAGYGIAALVCGIIALVLFCSCINIILPILALIFGLIQINRYNDRTGKHMAIGGIVTAVLSVICFCVFWGMLFFGGSAAFNNISEDEFFQYYYEFNNGDFDEFKNFDEFDNFDDEPVNPDNPFENVPGTSI